jgi:group I intron endonuclease
MRKIKSSIIGVYKILHIVSGRYYIGYSTNVENRFNVHRWKLEKNRHDNIFLQRAYNLYGKDEFNYDIIHICHTKDEAKEIELKYLTDLSIRHELYNLNYKNSGGDLLLNHPDKEAIREKIIKSCKETMNKLTSEERKQKYGRCREKNGMYGKTHTDEVKQRISEIAKKNGNKPFYGKRFSEETKQKLSTKAKLRTGDKNPFYGKHHSEETRRILSEKNKGNLPTNAMKILVDGNMYVSITEASRKLNVSMPTVLWRLKSKNPKFDNYKYYNDDNIEPSVVTDLLEPICSQ